MSTNKVSTSHLRSEYQRYIEEHKYLPEYMKEELQVLVARQFSHLGQIIGLVELTYRRTLAAEEKKKT